MLRFVILTTLISITLASYHHRYRRNEGNENSVKYYRPKYVYKFHGEESDEDSAPQNMDYKLDFKHSTKDKDSFLKHYMHQEEKEPEKIIHYGYQDVESNIENDEEVPQKDTEHHVEIKHEHGTSHQSFTMHHFHPARVFIKKQDLHYLKKPIETGVTKHSFKFVHPKKTTHETKIEVPIKFDLHDHYEIKEHYQPKQHSYQAKEISYQHKDSSPKYEYHVPKEMEIQPKKYVYHTYEEPTTFEHKAQPPKYELKEHYQYTKEPSPKIEYHLPKEYYSHQKYQQYHRESPKPVQGYKHTVYRGNNDSNEEVHYEEEAQESKEVHQDIHVYH